MKTFVYVISGDHGRQKIGCSNDPKQRIRELQTGSPYPLKFEFVGEAVDDVGGQIEVEAHFMLAQHRAEGEWFVVPPDVAVTAVMAASHRLGYRIKPVDPDAVAQKSYDIGRPSWHKWVGLPFSLFGLYWIFPDLMRFHRGELEYGYLIGACLPVIVMVLIGRWAVIKCVETLRAFDRTMHPEDGLKVPLSPDQK